MKRGHRALLGDELAAASQRGDEKNDDCGREGHGARMYAGTDFRLRYFVTRMRTRALATMSRAFFTAASEAPWADAASMS